MGVCHGGGAVSQSATKTSDARVPTDETASGLLVSMRKRGALKRSQLRSQADIDRERLRRRDHAVVGGRVGYGVGNHPRIEVGAKGRELPIEQIVHEALDLGRRTFSVAD